ncbi:chromate efflux transporter [Methylobacterium sp. NEAU 140]|uniref:chromate efflux transporter n=1 Tax=Methylobacterium sp. NEAU 140 TaxID=3064945 RepID=UPI0027341D0A|nr:chromate efflux transporter [Methylobacterium sp. NEAU 140]MDP4024003.1 chromate efflux transporter [Methylobacterium sp. NEAU 140]
MERRSETGRGGSVAEVALAFLRLGLTAFGGPAAHLGYFREALVRRRGWTDEAGYADLVALCQFLPGPASSQVAFALGLIRAGGLLGGLAAWAAFSLPSLALMTAFAAGAGALGGPHGAALLHGLKLAAVAVVAEAVRGMARSLAPDRTRATIAVAALAATALAPGSGGQVAAIALGAAAGLALCREPATGEGTRAPVPVSRRAGALALALFALLLVGAGPLAEALGAHMLAVCAAFYRAGALVFGGGHVVLPLLRAAVVDPGWVEPGAFLAGYGAAQAVPGPLFSLAAYLGAVLRPGPGGIAGAALAFAALSLPGLLVVYGALPFWGRLAARADARAALRGANAAVVGILAAALYDPVFTAAVGNARDLALAAACFMLLAVWRTPPWCVVALAALGGLALAGG